MNIFYSKSEGRADVSCDDEPVSVSLDTALAVFRGLDPRRGFMSIELDERFCLQLAHKKHGKVRVELLDRSVPAFDASDTEVEFAERLIKLAADGQDVFQFARTGNYDWEHWDLASKTVSKSSRSSSTSSGAHSKLSEIAEADGSVTPMEFTATECGFDDGLGGASNAAAGKDYHYALFGRQTDEQHPEFSGVYFEFDDQINGAANCVARVVIRDGAVDFDLKDGRRITVLRGMMAAQWDRFLSGIRDTFDHGIIQ